MYQQTRKDLLPFMGAGNSAINQLQNLLGLNGGNPSSMLAALQNTPGYQFAFNQGQTALDRSAASRGLLLSGGQLKDSINYGQGMADQVYQQTVGNLYNLGSLGENAAAGAGSLGQQAATGAGNAWQNAGAATASGYMGAANAFGGQNGVFQNAINAYQLMNPSSSGGDYGFNGVTPQFYDPTTGLSDRRAKTDIARVGTLDSGLPVYLFRYKGSKLPQMGVMADEVEAVAPHAVRTDPKTGFKLVSYGAVSRLPAFKEAA